MIIPEKVKIGGITYKVILTEEWYEHDYADGETFYDKHRGNIIYIRSSLTKEAQEVTLIHEAIHAMNSTMNHEFLDSLSEQLYQFLSDNELLK